MVRSRSSTGGMVAVAFGAGILSGAIVLSTAVVADRLAARDGAVVAPIVRQSHMVDRTNKTDPLTMTIRHDAPSTMLAGCESAFASPSPETLTRKPSRCVTELIAPGESNKLAALR